MIDYAEAYFDIMGEPFIIRVAYRVTYRGHAASWDEPAAAPEWETKRIVIWRDYPGDMPEFEATGALFDVLADDERVRASVMEQIAEDYAPRRSRIVSIF